MPTAKLQNSFEFKDQIFFIGMDVRNEAKRRLCDEEMKYLQGRIAWELKVAPLCKMAIASPKDSFWRGIEIQQSEAGRVHSSKLRRNGM